MNSYKTALITGASSGLGRGLAIYFAGKGVKVFAAARRKEQLDELEREGPDGLIVPQVLDVSDSDATFAAVQKLDEKCGGLDLVIANAGVGVPTNVKKVDWPKMRGLFDVNMQGAAATLMGAVPGMIDRKSGHLVGVSSLVSFSPLPATAAYCASKAFLAMFCESLRLDLSPLGVQVTTLHPGFVKSEMTAKNKFPMPFLLETDDAVKRMGKAIERGDAQFSFPWQLSAAVKTLGSLPRPLFTAAARKLR